MEDGFNDHRHLEIKPLAQGGLVAFATEDAVKHLGYSLPLRSGLRHLLLILSDDLAGLRIAVASNNGGQDDGGELPQFVPGACEVAFGFAGEAEVFTSLSLECRLPARFGGCFCFTICDQGEEAVCLPNLRRAGIDRLVNGQRLLSQLPRLGQPIGLVSQKVGEVVEDL